MTQPETSNPIFILQDMKEKILKEFALTFWNKTKGTRTNEVNSYWRFIFTPLVGLQTFSHYFSESALRPTKSSKSGFCDPKVGRRHSLWDADFNPIVSRHTLLYGWLSIYHFLDGPSHFGAIDLATDCLHLHLQSWDPAPL